MGYSNLIATSYLRLFPGPVGEVVIRQRLRDRIIKLDGEVLRGLFLALERLLGSR
jgi:hypothetical protein